MEVWNEFCCLENYFDWGFVICEHFEQNVWCVYESKYFCGVCRSVVFFCNCEVDKFGFLGWQNGDLLVLNVGRIKEHLATDVLRTQNLENVRTTREFGCIVNE